MNGWNIKEVLGRALLILPFIFPLSAFTQVVNPANGPLFLQNEVATLQIQMDSDSFAFMLANLEYSKTHDYPATFIYQSSLHSDTLENIGFRLRGNTSLFSAKKSFKVSFNAFEDGFDYFGIDKLNLNGEHNDPSVMRAKLSWEAQMSLGLPAARTSYVRLYVNGDYRGLYLNVEHIDRDFLASRFGDDGAGELFKCLYPADLAFMGNDPNAYKLDVNGRPVYDLKTNELADDYRGLTGFIDILNHTPSQDLGCDLETFFNVGDYLKIAAFDVLTANWDGYIYNKNNYYLYHNRRTDRFEFISYDLDNTFGIDWFNIDWANRDPYQWKTGNRPLFSRLMLVPDFRKQYTRHLKDLSEGILHPDSIRARAQAILSLIGPHIVDDPFYPLDYGFDTVDFHNSIEMGWQAHVPLGIAEYMDQRFAALQSQLDPVDSNLLTMNHLGCFRSSDDTLWFAVNVAFEPGSVTLNYEVNGGNQQSVAFFDDGAHKDGLPNDGKWGTFVLLPAVVDSLIYQVKAEKGLFSIIKPCQPALLDFRPSEIPLFINEFMASNRNVVVDEWGEYDDWIELYNAGNAALGLDGLYLTDDPKFPGKWKLPEVTLPASGFLLVWADKSQEDGLMHTNFRLDKDGEDVVFYEKSGKNYRIVDEINFGPQVTNVSYGRVKDGQNPWVSFSSSTPNSTNIIIENGPNPFTIWPNPNAGKTLFLSRPETLRITNSLGSAVFFGTEITQVNLSGFRSGLYVLEYSGGVRKFIVY